MGSKTTKCVNQHFDDADITELSENEIKNYRKSIEKYRAKESAIENNKIQKRMEKRQSFLFRKPDLSTQTTDEVKVQARISKLDETLMNRKKPRRMSLDKARLAASFMTKRLSFSENLRLAKTVYSDDPLKQIGDLENFIKVLPVNDNLKNYYNDLLKENPQFAAKLLASKIDEIDSKVADGGDTDIGSDSSDSSSEESSESSDDDDSDD